MRSDVSRSSRCAVQKTSFEPNPRPLDFFHAIPFANRQSKLARPVNNHIRNIHGLIFRVQHSGDVGELEKFFNRGEYGHDWVSRIVDRLLGNVFALKDLVGHQMTVVVLEVIQHVRHSVIG